MSPDFSSVNAVFPLGVYTIVDVDTGTEQFVIDGDQTNRILVNDTFSVVDSTGNDGVYTVASRSYASGPDETTITVNEDITDATVDGDILHDEIADEVPITLGHDDPNDRDAAEPDQIAGAHIQRVANEIRALGITVGVALGGEVIDAGGLDVYHTGFTLIFGSGTPIETPPNKLTLADNDDSYIEVNSSGTVSSNTTGFSNGQYPLALVTTLAGDITRIQDKRGALYLAEFTEANLDDLAASLFDPATELTISAGVVTRTQNVHRIDTEADAGTDDLDTINGGADGMLIIVRAENAARTVVLKDGTGNLALGGADISLDDTDPFIFLQYDGILSAWVIIGGVGGGGAPSGPAGGELGGTYPNPTVNDGADATAIHDDTAGEIVAVTEKVAPVGADVLLIEDSAAANAKKRVQITNLPTGSDADAIHDNVAAEISAITEKVAPVNADLILIEDSAAANVKKRIQAGNLPVPSGVLKADGSVDVQNMILEAPTELTISGGVVTRTQIIHAIDTEGDAASDDLDTISGGTDGMLIFIRAASNVRTVVLKDQVSNLYLNGADISLDDTDKYVLLEYDTDHMGWVIVGGLGGGGGAPSGPAGGELGGTYPNPTVNDGADATAIHDNVASEISAITEKVTPISADLVVIEDSAAANAKKRVQVGNLPGGAPSGPAGGDLGGTYPDPTVDDGADSTAIHDNVAAEISAITEKASPITADLLVIEDSAAANVKKRVQIGNLPTGSGAVWRFIDLPAGAWDYTLANPAPLDTDIGTNGTIKRQLFDDTTEEFVIAQIKMPSDLDSSGTVSFEAYGYAVTADGNEIQLRFSHDEADLGETWDGAFTAEDSGDYATDANQDELDEVKWTETVANLGWAGDDFVRIKLSRIAIDDGTPLSGDWGLTHFRLKIPRA